MSLVCKAGFFAGLCMCMWAGGTHFWAVLPPRGGITAVELRRPGNAPWSPEEKERSKEGTLEATLRAEKGGETDCKAPRIS